MAEDSKICPTCKKKFTRLDCEPPIHKSKWFTRVYCSKACVLEDRRRQKYGLKGF